MNKNLYKITDYELDKGIGYAGVEPYYCESENVKEILFRHILENYDLEKEDFKIGTIRIEKLNVKSWNHILKDMKNRTILK